MTQISRTVITAYANKAEAIEMSIVNGEQQYSFAGRACTKVDPNVAAPTHCYSSGTVDSDCIDRYEADADYIVSELVGENVDAALDAQGLQRWVDPNESV